MAPNGAGASGAQIADSVAAIVNNDVITERELADRTGLSAQVTAAMGVSVGAAQSITELRTRVKPKPPSGASARVSVAPVTFVRLRRCGSSFPVGLDD